MGCVVLSVFPALSLFLLHQMRAVARGGLGVPNSRVHVKGGPSHTSGSPELGPGI